MARPQIEVDERLLETLTKYHLSDKVIAECLAISVDTLHRRFADKMEIWRSKSKAKMAEVLWDEAMNKREQWALKAFAQKHLGYDDDSQKTDININLTLADRMAKARDRVKK